MFTQERSSSRPTDPLAVKRIKEHDLNFKKTNSLKNEITTRLNAAESFKNDFIQENSVSIV